MKDEGNNGATPWRWRTGWLNRRDDEIDDGSSSGTVDEGRRGVAVDDVVGEEAPAGWRTEQGVGFRRGFSRLEQRGYGGLGFRMAKRRRWEGGTMT